ncbi:Cytochrome [Forsythia ovata]|uniref:Cytochrome n=1 Tax=Forsythia ovata TaxID=205694 RepID=A0ABD1WEZ1_9LAMI
MAKAQAEVRQVFKGKDTIDKSDIQNLKKSSIQTIYQLAKIRLNLDHLEDNLTKEYDKMVTSKGWRRPKHQRLPPSPWKLPLIGHLHHLVGALPHHTLRNLAKKYGPIMHLKLGEVSTIVMSSRQIAKSVLTTHDLACANRQESIGMKTLCSVTSRAAFGEVIRDKDTLIMFIQKGLALAGGFDLADFYPSLKFLQYVSWNKYKLLKMRRQLD